MAISKTKVITGVNTRLSYFHGWEPTSINNGPERYSVSVLIPKSDTETVKAINEAMQTAVCKDSRARGMFQYYGANRTGRFAGRIIQLQNLPQNHMSDLADARALVRSGNYDALELLYSLRCPRCVLTSI